MSISRRGPVFIPIAGDAPAFTSSKMSTASLFALETTSRMWQGPSDRTVRIVSADATGDYYVQFGSSFASASSNFTQILQQQGHIFYVPPNIKYISLYSPSTFTANVALGYGGEIDEWIVRSAAGPASTVALFTPQQAGSILGGVFWMSDAPFTVGDAATILGVYHWVT